MVIDILNNALFLSSFQTLQQILHVIDFVLCTRCWIIPQIL